MSEEQKSLADKIVIKRQFLKAVRVDLDVTDRNALNGFIPLQSSLNVVDNMCAVILGKHNCAFTWSGAFGSGKSTLALLLSSLISQDSVIRNKALGFVKDFKNNHDDNNITKLFAKKGAYKYWSSINIVGSNTSLRNVLHSRLKEDKVTSEFYTASELNQAEISLFIDRLKDNNKRVLIIVDELGKFLQHAIETNDIYLLQELSEAAARSDGHLILLGIMHQSFESYIAKSDKSLKDEWAKIQGRFENQILAPSEFESINLVASSINNDEYHTEYDSSYIAKILYPKSNNLDAISRSFSNCLPLHPISILLVCAMSRLYFGQNERTIFGFLNSYEPFSFSTFLSSQSRDSSDLYLPSCLFDYIRNNQSLVGYGQTGKLYAEACEIITHLEGNSTLSQLNLFKTIAVMEIFGKGYSIYPKKEILEDIYRNIIASPYYCQTTDADASFENDIAALIDAKAVIYKSYDGSYGCFNGSDFDFDASFAKFYNSQDVKLDVIKQYIAESKTVVAKRHYVRTGSLRYFEVEAILLEDVFTESYKYQCTNTEIGKVFLVLSNDTGDKAKSFAEALSVAKYCSSICKNHIYAVCLKSAEIFNSARTLQTYKEMQSDPLLEGDAVARREVNERLRVEQLSLEQLVYNSLNDAFVVHNGSVLSKLCLTVDTETIPLLGYQLNSESRKYLDFEQLHALAINDANISTEHVVANEISARYSLSPEARKALEQLIDNDYAALYCVSKYLRNKDYTVKSADLWVLASDIADALFDQSPIIKNELINRNKISASVAKARRILLEHMCGYSDKQNLGFEKTPPEMNLYWTIFELHGLHRQNSTGYGFVLDDKSDPKIRALFDATDKLLISKPNVSAFEIFDLWSNQPFGVKAGLHLILLLFYMLVNKDRVAVYNDNFFVTDFSEDFVGDYLVNVDRFTFKLYKLDNTSLDAANSLFEAFRSLEIKCTSSEPLALARAIVFFMLKLPALTQRTINLSKRAQKLKSYVLNANDPLDLIYDKLFGLYPNIAKDNSLLIQDIKEIIEYYSQTLNKIQSLLFKSLGCSGADAVEQIKNRAESINEIAAANDSKVEMFIKRLSTFEGGRGSIEGIITLCTDKPVKSLNDHDIAVTLALIPELAMGFRKAECFAGYHDKQSDRRFVSVISSTPDGDDISEVVELTTQELHQATEQAQNILTTIGKCDYKQIVALCSQMLKLATR